MRTTPELITDLKPNEIFVFGSNESGIHGAGAARAAVNFGAKVGQGFGMAGKTFAIPTKDWLINTLNIDSIQFYVDRFITYTEHYPTLTFLVTPIGCGLAGYTVEEIAPLFERVYKYSALYENIILPQSFILFFEGQNVANFNSILNRNTKFSPNPTSL
jgi:hypothetical protein